MNSPLRNWSLRNRLTVGVLILSALGFIGGGLVVQTSLRGYLIGQIDEQLTSVIGGTSQRLNAAGIINDDEVNKFTNDMKTTKRKFGLFISISSKINKTKIIDMKTFTYENEIYYQFYEQHSIYWYF